VGLHGSESPNIEFAEHLRSQEHDELTRLLTGAAAVAIDAPAALSAGSHIGDTRLARKFQRARCSEVALRRIGIAVPYATPMIDDPIPSWMRTGFETWAVARAASRTIVETFPHAVFWQLAGRQLFHKQSFEGRAERRAVLAALVELPPGIAYWPHDALDALGCAIVAWQVERAEAQRVSCIDDDAWTTHDGSEMWLPVRSM
jgi:predicted nuclease with RNAse H fold